MTYDPCAICDGTGWEPFEHERIGEHGDVVERQTFVKPCSNGCTPPGMPDIRQPAPSLPF